MTLQLSPEDRVRAARALGWHPGHWRALATGRVPGGAAFLKFGDAAGRTAFLKVGTTPVTVDWLRAEARTYAVLHGPFLPEVFGFDDDGERPVLALEDLSSATWPPPWTRDDIEVVLSCLDRVAATPPPPHLPRLERGEARTGGRSWRIPDELMPHEAGLAAWVAGYFCARAGDPEIPDAVHVRPLQIRQARTALPWAARVLGLPPPG